MRKYTTSRILSTDICITRNYYKYNCLIRLPHYFLDKYLMVKYFLYQLWLLSQPQLLALSITETHIRRWYQTLLSLFWLLFGVGDPNSAYIVGAYCYFILVVKDLSLGQNSIVINIYHYDIATSQNYLNSSSFRMQSYPLKKHWTSLFILYLFTVDNLCPNKTTPCYDENHHQLTESTGFLLYVLYQLIGSIILMRMLIALMSAALSRIQVYIFSCYSITNVKS